MRFRLARESRLFPNLVYNIEAGDAFGSHFDLTGNDQTKSVIPNYLQTVKSDEKSMELESFLTIADYLSMFPQYSSNLEIIPSWYDEEDLVQIESYLNADYHAMDGKIPFIWGIDMDNKIHKVAIPISWVIFCRKRLDYWRFIQELGGVNNPLIDTIVDKVRNEWEVEKDDQIKDLEKKLQDEFEDVKNQELEKSITGMLYRLLEGNVDISKMAQQSTPEKDSSEAQELENQPIKGGVKPDVEDIKQVKPDVWVESDECTSCNDCIDALPGVFKYNDDKQAYVHNPTGGTYAKIVSTAEKCPAACIHPGLPHDPNEPNLDKLKVRAEKFN